MPQLRLERLRARCAPSRRFRPRHGEADRVLGAGLRNQDHRDADARAARENSRCAVPGTPIMPAPSTLTSATLIDARDALDRRGRRPARRRSACRRAPARRCCGSRSECPSPPPAPWSADAGPWRRSRPAPSPPRTTSSRSRVAPGREARIGAEHAVHIGPDDDLAGVAAGRRRSPPKSRCRFGRAWSAGPARRGRRSRGRSA